MENQVRKLLDSSRKDLLDFSMRNPLLNYRASKTRGLSLFCQQPDLVFKLLVDEKKSLGFKQKSSAQLPLKSDSAELISEAKINKSAPFKLETLESEQQLQKRLLSTFNTARSVLEEQGVNILYLTFGILHWLEDENSQEFRQAPVILIPVRIERKEVKDQFQISYSEADLGLNITLKAKLKSEFGIELPEFNDELDLPLVHYFNQVNQLIQHKDRWRLEAYKTELGFFSFGKFLIYNDLDSNLWPEDKQPFNHSLLSGLLNDGFNHSEFPSDDTFVDHHPQVNEVFQVVDADSSQLLNLLEVHQGKHLVIQGPPGTGKSQTITNIIGNAIGQGKKVLFVAEKMAALEVVKRRMDACGLGDACLELHSHKANKKDLLHELKRVLDLGKPKTSHLESELVQLQNRKDELNTYSLAVNSTLEGSSFSFHQIIGVLLSIGEQCKDIELPQLPADAMNSLDAESFRNALDLIDGLMRKLQEGGSPKSLVFYGSGLRTVLPKNVQQIKDVSAKLFQAFNDLSDIQQQIIANYQLPDLHNWKDRNNLCVLPEFIYSAPQLNQINLQSNKWLTHANQIDDLIIAGDQYKKFTQDVLVKLKEEILFNNWKEVLEIYQLHGHKWYRFFIGDFRRAKKIFHSFSNTVRPLKDSEIPDVLQIIIQAQENLKLINSHEKLAIELFSENWKITSVDFQWLKQIASLMKNYYEQLFSSEKAHLLETDKNIAREFQSSFKQASEKFVDAWENWKLELQFDSKQGPDFNLMNQGDIREFLLKIQSNIQDIHPTCSWNLTFDLIRERKLEYLIPLCLNWSHAAQLLSVVLKKNYLETLYEKAINQSGVLRKFDRNYHEEQIKKFRDEDLLNFRFNQAKAALVHFNSLPNAMAGGQMMVLRTEMNKKIRHLPLRKLIEQAGKAIQDIKPVFMMSPMSVATYLPPALLEFDLVIFDEASQVKPVEAFGSIIRGKQLVVVGDSKQLPPTNFFETISDELNEEEESITQEMESILGLANAKGIGGGMLRWHYRSKHESLIRVSNHEFYDNRLLVFPSANSHEKLGLKLRYHPDTFYDRGLTRTNKLEAEIIINALLNHVRKYPHLSIGLVAFSNAQKEVLEDLFERARNAYPELENFVQSHVEEPLFIKNLENVQGDERDVIFISVAYGKTKEGYLAMNFGPLNGVGGERRLNVLITRARQCCEVFTNITSSDLDLNRANSPGVKALKNFLYYAESGQLNLNKETGRPADSYFEIHVADQLRKAGYDVVNQVGANGFFIDLAVKDAKGNYIIGIECDGKMYHSARSARDRDRLRQQVLEAMGWTIHRIWSTDWFANPDREIRRTIEAIEKAKLDRNLPESIIELPPKSTVILREDVPNEKHIIPAYQIAQLQISLGDKEFHQLDISNLAQWIHEIVLIEAPVHMDEAFRRIIDSLQISRMGSRIKSHLESAVSWGIRQQLFSRNGQFLVQLNPQAISIRNRAELPSNSRKFEYISTEEMSLAFQKIVEEAYSIQDDEVVIMAAELFGFNRLTEDLKSDFTRAFASWKSSQMI